MQACRRRNVYLLENYGQIFRRWKSGYFLRIQKFVCFGGYGRPSLPLLTQAMKRGQKLCFSSGKLQALTPSRKCFTRYRPLRSTALFGRFTGLRWNGTFSAWPENRPSVVKELKKKIPKNLYELVINNKVC